MHASSIGILLIYFRPAKSEHPSLRLWPGVKRRFGRTLRRAPDKTHKCRANCIQPPRFLEVDWSLWDIRGTFLHRLMRACEGTLGSCCFHCPHVKFEMGKTAAPQCQAIIAMKVGHQTPQNQMTSYAPQNATDATSSMNSYSSSSSNKAYEYDNRDILYYGYRKDVIAVT